MFKFVKVYFTKCDFVVNSPKLAPTKISEFAPNKAEPILHILYVLGYTFCTQSASGYSMYYNIHTYFNFKHLHTISSSQITMNNFFVAK